MQADQLECRGKGIVSMLCDSHFTLPWPRVLYPPLLVVHYITSFFLTPISDTLDEVLG